MVLIANPIYDSVFKFLMEDQKVAKLLLSALLKKEIVELEMKQQVIEQKEQMIGSMVKMMHQNGIALEQIAEQLALPLEQIEKYLEGEY